MHRPPGFGLTIAAKQESNHGGIAMKAIND